MFVKRYIPSSSVLQSQFWSSMASRVANRTLNVDRTKTTLSCCCCYSICKQV